MNNAENNTAGRNPFQHDFDKIVFSSAFRRLQDKTQVFPLSESDYVRTRLTHSLEVSCVGRSLGTLVGERVIKKYGIEKFYPADFGTIVAAACLAHDIGNPPFGHSGEDAIKHWFQTSSLAREVLGELDESHKQDFTEFEGNAQGFRLLTRLQNPQNRGGMQLTAAVLASFTKYPRSSQIHGPRSTDGASLKKHGFFLAEQPFFEEVANATGLTPRLQSMAWQRHPLAYLVEAADDICYCIIDIEDGFRLGHISFDRTREFLLPLCPKSTKRNVKAIQGEKERVERLRAGAINSVIEAVAHRFEEKEAEILRGEYDREIIKDIPQYSELEKIEKVERQEIYRAHPVLEIEAAGFEVLGGMLDLFVAAVTDAARNNKPSAKSKKLLELLTNQFLGNDRKPDTDPYIRLLKITDYVCGMTDSYAVSTFKKLRGISLPHS